VIVPAVIASRRRFPCPLRYPASASTAVRRSDFRRPSSSVSSSSRRSWSQSWSRSRANSSSVAHSGGAPFSSSRLDLRRSARLMLPTAVSSFLPGFPAWPRQPEGLHRLSSISTPADHTSPLSTDLMKECRLAGRRIPTTAVALPGKVTRSDTPLGPRGKRAREGLGEPVRDGGPAHAGGRFGGFDRFSFMEGEFAFEFILPSTRICPARTPRLSCSTSRASPMPPTAIRSLHGRWRRPRSMSRRGITAARSTRCLPTAARALEEQGIPPLHRPPDRVAATSLAGRSPRPRHRWAPRPRPRRLARAGRRCAGPEAPPRSAKRSRPCARATPLFALHVHRAHRAGMLEEHH
jgi:hypothetical protein